MRGGLAGVVFAIALLGGRGAIGQNVSAPPPAAAPSPPLAPPEKRIAFGFTTLNLLRDKGVITPAEYEGALRDLGEPVGAKAGESLSLMLSKWSATLYGFAETDLIYDTTQSLNEVPGNAQIARPDTYAGTHGRFMVGIRNSRLGIRVRAPEWHGIRASAVAEMDFLGTQATTTSEAATFTSPLLRARHYNLKIETPVVDFLFGQTWSLFGWQPFYFPNSVEIMGLPAQLFFRTPQLRVSKTIKTAPINVEIAAALVRSPQRDSGTPEGQGGVRLIVNKWTGVQTINSTGTQISPMSVGVSGTLRHLSLTEFSATPKNSVELTGWGLAASAFIPVLPGRADKRGNSLSLTGEFVYGLGIADEYPGLVGGVASPPLPNPTMATPAPVYTPNIDPGLVAFTADGVAHLIKWQTFIVGAQYTLPGLDGRMWLSANFSRSTSANAGSYGTPGKVRAGEDFIDASIFGDITPAVRLGAEYAWFNDHYAGAEVKVPPVDAINHRFQFSAFYIF
jgi:hypothetical protein